MQNLTVLSLTLVCAMVAIYTVPVTSFTQVESSILHRQVRQSVDCSSKTCKDCKAPCTGCDMCPLCAFCFGNTAPPCDNCKFCGSGNNAIKDCKKKCQRGKNTDTCRACRKNC
eukprot:TRINITY_DN3576_c0_g1_i1.p1 TRINITY_DN3576_c0_g1~~TRINITY_DN3576_c0_g1_i1.p1  ORF type:complete len:113 (-),score=5.25 TRINITY_DN3576_c0_g1_i1:367-705(-)